MKVNVPVNGVDVIILIILALLFIGGVRIVIGFFKKPERPHTEAYEKDSKEE